MLGPDAVRISEKRTVTRTPSSICGQAPNETGRSETGRRWKYQPGLAGYPRYLDDVDKVASGA